MAENISPGIVVELKSGGPRMTVEWIDGDSAYCSWFDTKDEQHSKPFKLAALQPATSLR